MPTVLVQCPHCSHSDTIDDSLIGRRAPCKHCGHSLEFAPSGEMAGTASGSDPELGPSASSSASSAPLPPKIGRFLIKERLGNGSCGCVYRAVDPTLERDVALKVPHSEYQRDEMAIERFMREAKAAARLQHPHIIPVYEAGTDGETFYIASAFIAGRSLADAIADGPFAPLRAARIVASLADALHKAHEQGIIHRDVKPANMLLDSDDRPHLTDFGLARLAAAGAKLTKVGSILGTPAYLAPERAQGRSDQAEPASDQYSLGVTLYELLSGHVPFAGPLDVAIFHTLNSPPPPLRGFHLEVPPELEAICFKALAKKPEERYPSCQELGVDLRNWLSGEPISVTVGAQSAMAPVGAKRGPGASPRTAPSTRQMRGLSLHRHSARWARRLVACSRTEGLSRPRLLRRCSCRSWVWWDISRPATATTRSIAANRRPRRSRHRKPKPRLVRWRSKPARL